MSETEQPGDGISEEFVRENRRHVRTLLESFESMDGTADREAVDEAFRAAHSLKANCELAGLDDAGAVAHAVEDVLAAARAGDGVVDEPTVETAVAAVETIERVIDGAPDGDDIPTIDADGWTERLRGRLDGTEADDGDADEEETADDDADETTAADGDAEPAGDADVDLDDLGLDAEARAAFESAGDYDDLDALVAAMDDEAGAYADLDGGGSFDELEATAADEESTAAGANAAVEEDAAADAATDAGTETPKTEPTDAGEGAIPGPDPDAPAGTTADTARGDLPAPDPDLAPATGQPVDTVERDGTSDGVAVPGLDGAADAAATIAASSLDGERFDIPDDEGHESESDPRTLGAARSLAVERRRLVRALDDADLDGHAADALTSLRTAADTLCGAVAGDLRRLDALASDLERAVERAARHVETPVAFVADIAPVAVDRSIVDRLSEPLVHCVRNAVDHGIEGPRERGAAAKPEAGTVTVRGRREGGRLVVTVADDGRGIDADAVREAAVEAGVEGAADATDDAVLDLLFEAGVSTADADSDLSGRGVGMDVVGRAMADLDGDVTVDSTPGAGTTVRLSVPVTEVVTRVRFVAVGPETYAVPSSTVTGVLPAAEATVRNGAVQVPGDELERDAMGTATAFGSTLAYRPVDLATALSVPDGRPDAGERSGGNDGDGTTALGSASEPAGNPSGEPAFLLVDPEAAGTGHDETTADARVALRCDDVLGEHGTLVTPLRGVDASPAVDGAVVCDAGRVVPVVDPRAFTGGR